MLLYPVTIFLSAFLLFLVQPIIAKQILPWFGGSAGVWSVCLVFFQMLLLGGYAYAHALSRGLHKRGVNQPWRSIIHIALLLASLIFLPIIASPDWKPLTSEDPLWRIVGLLMATIGMPYFLLASTGPLVQYWFAAREPDAIRRSKVYRLFAWSNLGSLLGLLAYPFAVEPFASVHLQAQVWSDAYVLFVLCAGACAWRARTMTTMTHDIEPVDAMALNPAPRLGPQLRQQLRWIMLAAIASVLLLAVTSHITQNIASIPFLWVMPLGLYLLSFVVCFEGRGGQGWYARTWWLLPVLAATLAMAWGLTAHHGVLSIYIAIPLYCSGLFIACVFCHGELAASKPAPQYLTRFYLALAAGGALGGLLVALVAPLVFDNYWELPLGLIALASLVLHACKFLYRGRRGRWRIAAFVLALATLLATAYFAWAYQRFMVEDTLVMSRNFYGSLRVKKSGTGSQEVHRLLHGVILHGEQYVDAAQRDVPGTYYGPTSGVGLAVQMIRSTMPRAADSSIDLSINSNHSSRIGSIGLGTGTLAAYGQPGDVYRIYEINPAVLHLAQTQFSYLADSRAKVEVVMGDARLSLERELAAGLFARIEQRYDVLSIDAFSSDAIPVHLMTREAMALYARALKPDGVMAFHVSNRFLNLVPVVQQLAQDAGYSAWQIDDHPQDTQHYSGSLWVLVTRNRAFLDDPEIAGAGSAPPPLKGQRIWTDQFNNLYQALKPPDR